MSVWYVLFKTLSWQLNFFLYKKKKKSTWKLPPFAKLDSTNLTYIVKWSQIAILHCEHSGDSKDYFGKYFILPKLVCILELKVLQNWIWKLLFHADLSQFWFSSFVCFSSYAILFMVTFSPEWFLNATTSVVT